MSLTRRAFLKASSLTGLALTLGVTRDERVFVIAPSSGQRPRFTPNRWLRIEQSGTIVITAHRSEMGQGVRTSLPMIVAEELCADWSRVTVEHARPGPDFPGMRTSGSSSVVEAWRPLRLAAAAAREMLITAAALTWRIDRGTCIADQGAIVHQPTGRRLAFGDLVARASELEVPVGVPLRDPTSFRLVGKRVMTVDTPAIVAGRATYGIDVRVPRMAFATIARAPSLAGTVRRWSAERARQLPGVRAIVPVSRGIAVIAESTWAALRARAALDIDWDAGGTAANSDAFAQAMESAIERGKVAKAKGDLSMAQRSVSREIEATYRWPFQAHAAMEPLNCCADVRQDKCEVWVGTQAPNEVQDAIAKHLSLPPTDVTVNVMLLGGGFGRRLAVDYAIDAVEVSRAIGAPVQVLWTREDDIQHDMYQPCQVNRLTAGLDAHGDIVSWRHRVADCNLTMYGPFDPNFDPATGDDPWGGHDTPYEFPAMEIRLALLEAPVPTGAWRSVTYPAAACARECFLDEVAHATGRDPVAMRLALLSSPGERRVDGVILANGDRMRRVVALAADRATWHSPFPRERDGRLWGRGIACNGMHEETMVAQVAEVSVDAKGDVKVHRVVCAVDCGQVVNLSGVESQFEGGVVWALSAALNTEITIRQGRVEQSNFHDFPVVRMDEAPMVEVVVVSSTSGPFGIGELPVPAVAPAVLNAVFAATGKRVRDLPLRARDLVGSS